MGAGPGAGVCDEVGWTGRAMGKKQPEEPHPLTAPTPGGHEDPRRVPQPKEAGHSSEKADGRHGAGTTSPLGAVSGSREAPGTVQDLSSHLMPVTEQGRASQVTLPVVLCRRGNTMFGLHLLLLTCDPLPGK